MREMKPRANTRSRLRKMFAKVSVRMIAFKGRDHSVAHVDEPFAMVARTRVNAIWQTDRR